MTTTGKVFLSCAFGSGIGALVALSLWQPIWWLGGIVGFLGGYLAYDFRGIVRAVSTAWQMGIRPRSRVRLRIFGRNFTTMMILYGNILPVLVAFFYYIFEANLPQSIVRSVITLIGFGLIATWMAPSYSKPVKGSRGFSELRRFHPLYVYGYLIPRLLWQAVWQTARFAPRLAAGTMMAIVAVVVACARFVRYLFILIHSELRLLCGADAMLGAVVGYFFGHALIGAIAGGLLGVVNHEFVSRRWLHLVSSR